MQPETKEALPAGSTVITAIAVINQHTNKHRVETTFYNHLSLKILAWYSGYNLVLPAAMEASYCGLLVCTV